MNAAHADQLRLLDLADIDARRAQADHARRNPPQAARIGELVKVKQQLAQELAARQNIVDDVTVELRRVEGDVALVVARRQRDEQLLQKTVSAKDAVGLERELASLTRRQDELEEAQLELMERLEAAEAAVTEQQQLVAANNDEGSRLSAEAKETVEAASALEQQLGRDRAAVAGAVPEQLLALYEKLATRSAGAALFQARTCGGCHMMLSGTDLAALRQVADDVVATCPECGCILVRTAESGL
ncbi:C4-type zinc ribbon domain-containing protein [Microbacterium sp. BG28]|uniref:zinc ribbon domain-containing protein n=1 Tax=Microbacterium sp. BG28 TaxID=3097356 RepID=UPI002A5A15D7|nr:C4-type zinc ribbon domain-containing protein [Microbacterium sp. BG28]MDY0829416.1 C4-type zinc ribbon domain-containing protein [Microbacterium sp. BG28]